jgi:hypothetical protein
MPDLHALADGIPPGEERRVGYAREHAAAILAALDGVADRAEAAGEPVRDVDAFAALLELTHLPPLRERPDTRVLLARLAAHLPISGRLANVVSGCSSLAFEQAREGGPPEAGRLLGIAARRDAFPYGNRLALALAGLPESLEPAEALLAESSCDKPAVALEFQAEILRRTEGAARSRALAAFYRGAGAQHADEALPALAAAGAFRPAIPALAAAAVVRAGTLHRALARVASTERHAELAPLLAWIAENGDLAAHDAAERAADLPAVKPAPHHTGETGGSPVAAVRKIVDAAPPDPWTLEERRQVAQLADDAPWAPILALVQRAADAPGLSGAAEDRLVAAVEWLGKKPRILESGPRGRVLELVTHRLPRVAIAAQAGLLRALGPDGLRLSSAERQGLATRFRAQTSAFQARGALPGPMRLGPARLGLPFTLEEWRRAREARFDDDDVTEWDQDVAFALSPEEAAPVFAALYGDATPNQRRALARTAPLAAAPEHLAPLLVQAYALEPSFALALLDRVRELRPAGAGATLIRLAGTTLPLPGRLACVATAGALATADELPSLGALQADPALADAVEKAVAETQARLRNAGTSLATGGLALADPSVGDLSLSDAGELSVAEVGAVPSPVAPSSPPVAPPASPALVPATGRPELLRLAAPPRGVALPVGLALLVLADNRWGALWVNGAVAGAVFLVDSRHPTAGRVAPLLGAVAFFLLNHWLQDTLPMLRALRSGVVAMGTPSTKIDVTRRKGRDLRQWRHSVRYLGDDGKMYTHVVTRSARLGALDDEALEPLLVRSGRDGKPIDVVAVDALRVARLTPDGRIALRPSAWVWLLVALAPAVALLYDAVT